jgi:hypothetical protein
MKAEEFQGTPTQSHKSPRILVYEKKPGLIKQTPDRNKEGSNPAQIGQKPTSIKPPPDGTITNPHVKTKSINFRLEMCIDRP